MTGPIPQRLASWLAVLLMMFSFSAACVVETDDEDGVEQVDTDEEDGAEVETEVEVEDEETP